MSDVVKKFCISCETEKPIYEFGIYKRNKKDGHNPKCKDCKRNYENNRNTILKTNHEQNHEPTTQEKINVIIDNITEYKDNSDKLIEFSQELKRLGEIMSIEEKCTPANSIRMPWTPQKDEVHDKNVFIMKYLNAGCNIFLKSDDIIIIKYDSDYLFYNKEMELTPEQREKILQ